MGSMPCNISSSMQQDGKPENSSSTVQSMCKTRAGVEEKLAVLEHPKQRGLQAACERG